MKFDQLKQAEEFNQIWETRYQPPYVTDSWVNNEWAKGRTEYLTFLIRVRERKIIERIKKIQAELADYECIDSFPEEYFHITVKELNYFLVAEKQSPDEYTEEELPKLIKGAQERLKPFKPFKLRLENLNNFKSTVCVQAHDRGVIRNINGALLQIPGIQKLKNDYPRFLPHLSIAQYKSTEDYEQLTQYLEHNRETKVGSLKVDSIKLVIAELPINGRYPKLKDLEEFRLG